MAYAPRAQAPLQRAIISVAEVKPPEAGRKNGKVFTVDGQTLYASPDKLQYISPGGQYEISFSDNNFNGQVYRMIQFAKQITAPQGVVSVPTVQIAPLPQPATGSYYTPKPADPVPERIFVCGAYNSYLSNPNINPAVLTVQQLEAFINLQRQLWRMTMKNPPKDTIETGPQSGVDPDLNDEIPFK